MPVDIKPPPQEILDIIWPALQVGGISGISGITIGAFAGVLRSTTPTLFALASGIQWFTLGTTFWASRGVLLEIWGRDKVTTQEKVQASSIAGGLSGAAGGLLRGRKNVIPGAIMFAIFGAAGQALYNRADARKTEQGDEKRDIKDSWLNSRWSPMQVLTDEEYKKMMEEKLLKIKVELALVDESIEGLKAIERENAHVERERVVEKEKERS